MVDAATTGPLRSSCRQIMKRKARRKKRSLTFRVLYYWSKFIGINALSLSTSNRLKFSYFGLFYGCSLITFFLFIFYRVVSERMGTLSPGETPVGALVRSIILVIYFVQNTATWFVCAFHQNRIINIVSRFVRLQKASRKICLAEDYAQRFRQLGIYLIVINAMFFSSMSLNYILWSTHASSEVILWVFYTYARMTVLNMGTVFIWILRTVRHKFHRLNDQMEVILRNKFVRNASLSDRINIVKHLHREVREVLHRVHKFFALTLLLEIGTQFATLTLNLYIIYMFVKAHSPMERTNLFYLSVMSHWLLVPVSLLIVISSVCSSTVDEANKTGHILHATLNSINRIGDPQDTVKFNVLSLELLHNEVKLTLYGFFDLDYSLYKRVMAAASMYLTIMLQFNS